MPATTETTRSADKISNTVTKGASKRSNSSVDNSNSELDSLLWRLSARTTSVDKQGTIYGLTSCGPKSGVSTLATNLAIRASNNHMGPVLLIDANIKSPRLHRIFRQDGKVGLMDLLSGSSTPDEAIRPTSVTELDLLPLGSKETLRNGRIIPENYAHFTQWVREHYSTVFVDFTSIEWLRHSLMLARLTDSTIVAIRCEGARRSEVSTALERLNEDGVKIGGTVLTRRRIYTPKWFRHA